MPSSHVQNWSLPKHFFETKHRLDVFFVVALGYMVQRQLNLKHGIKVL